MAGKAVIRCHYRGLLNADPQSEEAKRALAACRENAEALIREGKLMTAALYHYGRQLFLYFEALADECPPEGWMAPLHPHLVSWPQKEETRDWAKMYHIYWHCEPKDEADWRRDPAPQRDHGADLERTRRAGEGRPPDAVPLRRDARIALHAEHAREGRAGAAPGRLRDRLVPQVRRV